MTFDDAENNSLSVSAALSFCLLDFLSDFFLLLGKAILDFVFVVAASVAALTAEAVFPEGTC